uniref:DNA-dependent metalloprotease SPRTN n=2 Tax=Tetraodon nigroviridis TaxID=99883 RepID=H3C7U5_TETNG
MDEDFLLAFRLQEQFNRYFRTKQQEELERPLSIVDESWEMLDPNPDVRAMFLEFNDMFFWGKLSGVEVKWSPRMTLCAGVCSYEGRGGLCSIRLSEPLLKLRPRKDLVETLLHEMIHALLFVTQNNRDRDGHGPEFCKHMNRINEASGTKITVYHSFHDEVDVYRQHWWRCDGPCQNRRPYFGYVKRAMNRAPSALDPWWEDHRSTCGGTYVKVKEPEGYGKKGRKDAKKEGKNVENKATGNAKSAGLQDIRNIIPFSGKGFVLGGNSQSSTSSPASHKPAAPVAVTSSSDLIFAPSSPQKAPASPTPSSLDHRGTPLSVSGRKPPVKKSVGNSKAFVNVNGSPVKIPKPRSVGSHKDGKKARQKSIEDSFGFRKPSAEGSVAAGGPAEPAESQYFSHSSSNGGSSRKRTWDVHNDSASIFDFFQKAMSSDPSLRVTPSDAAAATSTPALMVSCPVCQAKVQGSKINEHLDSCL